jgi:hypothetical protein
VARNRLTSHAPDSAPDRSGPTIIVCAATGHRPPPPPAANGPTRSASPLHALVRPGRRVVGCAAAGVLLAALLITHPGPPAGRADPARPLITVVATTADGHPATMPVTVTSADQPDYEIIQGDPDTTVVLTALADSPAGMTTLSVTAGHAPPITTHAAHAPIPGITGITGRPISRRFAPAVRGIAAYTTITVNAVAGDGHTNRLRVYLLTRGLPLPSVDTFTATLLPGRTPSVAARWSIRWCGEVPPGSCKVTIWYKLTTAGSAPTWIRAHATTHPTGTATIALGTAHTPLPAQWTAMDWFATAETPASTDLPTQYRDLPLGEPPPATHTRFFH